MRLQVDRQLDVTLTEWRMFQQLPHLVHIPLREVDRRKTLHYKQAVVLIVEMELINSSSGYDDIIAVFKAHFTISTQQFTAAFMYEDHLIGIGVLVEIICHALLRGCKRYVEVVVVYGFSAFQVSSSG